MKVFGREPAVYIAVVEAVLAFLVTFGFSGLTAEESTNILAVAIAIGGVLAAMTTRNTLLAALSGVARAVLVLSVSYGLNLSQEQVGLTVVIVSTISGIWLRTQTSPSDTALSAA